MTVDEFFAQADRLPFVELEELIGDGGLVVVAPHPDDESLGCGGLLALCRAAGRAVCILIVSDGAGSHTKSTAFPPDRLRHLREGEARDAVRCLGHSEADLRFLRAPDGLVPRDGPMANELAERIADAVRRIDASAIAVTWRFDPHCDHQACFLLARRAADETATRLIEYPVWGHTLKNADLARPAGVRIDISDVIVRKRAAIDAHRSQTTALIDDDPDGFMLSAEMIARFSRPFEIFLGAL